MLQRFGDGFLRIFVILQLAGEEAVVGGHVEVAVAGQAEEDGLGLAGRLAAERLVNRGADGVAGLRRRDDAFGAGELDAGFKGRHLRHSDGFQQLFVTVSAVWRRALCSQALLHGF